MILLLTILKGFLLGWLLSHFEPLQDLIKWATRNISDKYYIVWYAKTALGCWKCSSLWLTLFIFEDIYAAAGAAFTAYVIDKKLL